MDEKRWVMSWGEKHNVEVFGRKTYRDLKMVNDAPWFVFLSPSPSSPSHFLPLSLICSSARSTPRPVPLLIIFWSHTNFCSPPSPSILFSLPQLLMYCVLCSGYALYGPIASSTGHKRPGIP